MAIRSVSQLNKIMQGWATKEVQKMQTDLYESIKSETPVDTGTAQRGWTNQEITNIGKTGVIENLVPYIGWLEFDTETRAGYSMVRRNIQKVIK